MAHNTQINSQIPVMPLFSIWCCILNAKNMYPLHLILRTKPSYRPKSKSYKFFGSPEFIAFNQIKEKITSSYILNFHSNQLCCIFKASRDAAHAHNRHAQHLSPACILFAIDLKYMCNLAIGRDVVTFSLKFPLTCTLHPPIWFVFQCVLDLSSLGP